MRRSLLVALACGGALLAPLLALAHAAPILYEPAPGTVLDAAPAEVRLRFSERPEEKASGFVVVHPDGSRQSQPAAVDPQDEYALVMPVADAGPGTYSALWQVVSGDDGHFTRGAFQFSVGAATQAAAAHVAFSSSLPEALATGLEIVGYALLFAALWAMFALREMQPWRRVLLAGAILAAFAGGAYIILKSHELALVQQRPLFDALTAFLSTSAGRFALARMGCMALVCVASALTLLHRRFAWLALAATLGAVALRACSSHAAASLFQPQLSMAVNALHLFAKASWVGVVGVLAWRSWSGAAREDRRADLMLAALFALTGMTASYVIWLHAKSFANLLATSWGSALLLLLAAAVPFVLLRMAAAFGWVPATKLVRWEAAAGIAMLLLSGHALITTPPMAARPFHAARESEGARIALAAHPAVMGGLRLSLSEGSHPLVPKELSVRISKPASGIGPLSVSPQPENRGRYLLDPSAFVPPGDWVVEVVAKREAAYDARASFAVIMPLGIDAGHTARAFDGFAMLMSLAAAVAATLGIVMARRKTPFL